MLAVSHIMLQPSEEYVSLEESCRRLLRGRSHEELLFCRQYLAARLTPGPSQRPSFSAACYVLVLLLSLLIPLFFPLLYPSWLQLRRTLNANPCLIPNNFALMEATRPVSSCDICTADLPVRLDRPGRAEFAAHAYRGRPVLVRGATETWPARRSVDLAFLRRWYTQLSANASVAEDGCQFLAFRSPLESLQQLMEGRVDAATGGPPWYIGWSNCDPRVAAMLRDLYRWPDFLPEDGEGSAIDWIFMGTPGQGTAVHIDNVHRPSWQAQIRGSKRWSLFPPPECEHVCRPVIVDVHPGDIFLLDTNQWYHGTEVIGKEMSITIGSEYD